MKARHERHSKDREFSPEDKVLVLLPIPGQSLQARYFGPDLTERKVSDTDYIVQTRSRRKQR